MSPTPQSPPTDRPLTAGDVPLLRRGDILDHHGDTVTVDRVGDLIQYSGHGFWGNDAPEKFAFVSRPATSAASEVTTQACVDWEEYADDIADVISDSLEMDWTSSDGARSVVRWLNENAPYSPALASPPVSERERELEGALRLAATAIGCLTFDDEIRSIIGNTNFEILKANAAEIRRLTGQPNRSPSDG